MMTAEEKYKEMVLFRYCVDNRLKFFCNELNELYWGLCGSEGIIPFEKIEETKQKLLDIKTSVNKSLIYIDNIPMLERLNNLELHIYNKWGIKS